jgi:mono/diheme cytochrome c family protein
MDRFMKLIGMGVIVTGLFLAVLLASGSSASSRAMPQATPQDVYLDKCAICHGKDGSGNTAKGRKLKVKDARSPDVQKLSEAEMIDIVAKGKGKDMDGFEKELGKDMVKSIVAYYRSLAAAH